MIFLHDPDIFPHNEQKNKMLREFDTRLTRKTEACLPSVPRNSKSYLGLELNFPE